MLILPLHQPITRANFPWVTMLLLVCNLLVFTALQSKDTSHWQRADAYYWESGLAQIETPLFQRHLKEHPDPRLDDLLRRMPAQRHAELYNQWRQRDRNFRQRLQSGELFDDGAERQTWQAALPRYQRLRAEVITDRWALHADDPHASTLLSSMFLHGGWDHLLGNMLFLLALGLLVEGALGAWLFLSLYLLVGAAAGGVWWLVNSGSVGSVIGASGAIAGLMGAFCVLWGWRRVRFFYWFFVVFDYVRGPALALLPLWLGWEVLQWWLRDGERVAYEAHAGGIVAGAALALLVRQLRWQREAFFEVAEPTHSVEAELNRAMQHLGHMRLREAEAALAAIERRQPGRFDVALARCRCARYAGHSQQWLRRAELLLQRTPVDAAESKEQAAIAKELIDAGETLPNSARAALVPRLLQQGDKRSAIELALGWDRQAADGADGAQLMLRLALGLHAAGAEDDARRVLDQLRDRFADSVQAGKAAFLQKEWGE